MKTRLMEDTADGTQALIAFPIVGKKARSNQKWAVIWLERAREIAVMKPKLRGEAARVMWLLIANMSFGTESRTKMDALAKDLGTQRQNVERACEFLEASGLITIEKKLGVALDPKLVFRGKFQSACAARKKADVAAIKADEEQKLRERIAAIVAAPKAEQRKLSAAIDDIDEWSECERELDVIEFERGLAVWQKTGNLREAIAVIDAEHIRLDLTRYIGAQLMVA